MNELNKDLYKDLNILPLDLDGWHGNDPIFRELILEKQPEVIIEVGTWKGQSAINMALICKELGLKTKIYCIDTWLGALEFWHGLNHTPERNLMLKNGYPQIYYQFLSNVVHKGVQDYIIPVPLPSSIGFKLLKKMNIVADLIYIDGSHDYEDVISDLYATKHVSSLNKTVIFGDDWNTFADVQKAVDLFSQKHVRFLNLEIKGNFWVLR